MNPPRSVRPERLHAMTDPDETDLTPVPRTFVHSDCGQMTSLSAATVRRILQDPFRLRRAGSGVYCASCGRMVPAADCTWEPTGENVRTYFRRLIGESLTAAPYSWIGRFLFVWLIVAPFLIAVVPLAYLSYGGDRRTAEWISIAAAAAVLVGFVIKLAQTASTYRDCAREYLDWCETAPSGDRNRSAG